MYKIKFAGINFADPKWTDLSVASCVVADCSYEIAILTSVKVYHVYKGIREVTIGENLPCQVELNN